MSGWNCRHAYELDGLKQALPRVPRLKSINGTEIKSSFGGRFGSSRTPNSARKTRQVRPKLKSTPPSDSKGKFRGHSDAKSAEKENSARNGSSTSGSLTKSSPSGRSSTRDSKPQSTTGTSVNAGGRDGREKRANSDLLCLLSPLSGGKEKEQEQEQEQEQEEEQEAEQVDALDSSLMAPLLIDVSVDELRPRTDDYNGTSTSRRGRKD
jgi:hypothetical protein